MNLRIATSDILVGRIAHIKYYRGHHIWHACMTVQNRLIDHGQLGTQKASGCGGLIWSNREGCLQKVILAILVEASTGNSVASCVIVHEADE